MTISDRVRVKNVKILSDDYYLLKKTTFEYRRANGEWQEQTRETYDRGNCATVLPYNLAQRTVILVRQFRYPAYVNGYDDLLIETAAGVLVVMRRKCVSGPRRKRKWGIGSARSQKSSRLSPARER